ncbi:MAG: LysM peptidoglycan-binding domain-containing protein [Verrucomicrobiota bacterium]
MFIIIVTNLNSTNYRSHRLIMKISSITAPALACILACASVSCKSSDQASTDPYADPYGYGYGTNPYGQPEQGAYQSTNNDYVSVTPTQPSNDYANAYQQQPAYSEPSYTAPSPSYSSPASSSSGRTYTVQSGDNLYRIGLNHGVNVSALKSANGLSSDIIHPGDVLTIP